MSWVKKVFTDFTTIIDAAFLNGLQDQIITDEETLAAKAGQGSLAEAYSASSTYAVGDLCTHEGGLYQCTTAIPTAEEWNAAHWEAVIIGDEVTRLNQAINLLDTRLKSGLEADAELHLGFYLDENGDLCQVDEEENNG